MPKYLLKASYTAEGVRGVIKDGGTKREAAVRALTESLGGKLDTFYFAFGSDDVILICDFPDAPHALAAAMAASSAGTSRASITPLILPAEIDAAAKLHGTYRAPGA